MNNLSIVILSSLPIILGLSLAVNANAQQTGNQTLPHTIFQSPHTLVLKGDLQLTSTSLWTEVDTAKTQGYRITSVAIDSYTAALPGSLSSEPALYETVLIVMEKG